ncbi:Uncharacterised protein [Bordetella pertussis]|nr:Uncharacterised protein [Bordetella pertussis]
MEILGASMAVGSSSRMTEGSISRARPNSTKRCWPPLMLETGSWRFCARMGKRW